MKLFEALEKQLKKEPNYVTDNGELKKWVVVTKAQNFDAELIELLLDDKELKDKFFVDVKGTLVFNQNLFVQFLEQKNYLNDSYTQYKNKVGLTIDGKYLRQRNEVALVWPFKDCVLEGGQSREEGKREEIFFNEILAQDEITQLLEPKVLTNAKTCTTEGEQDFAGFTRDAELNKKRGLPENTITDNLIIKGNNLLALHSLKKCFAGKVKLIYIDPPYNTGNGTFGYNDSFSWSTWLTFIKNRLEVARNLLSDDGSIWINIDDDGSHYLKILCDEIFKQENFVRNVVWQKRTSPDMMATIGDGHEHILVFAKKIEAFKPTVNKLPKTEKQRAAYKNPDNDPRGPWVSSDYTAQGYRPNQMYKIVTPGGAEHYPPEGYCWKNVESVFKQLVEGGRMWFGRDGKGVPRRKTYLYESEGQTVWSWWPNSEVGHTQEAKKETNAIFGKTDIFQTPKPERLAQRILQAASNKGDLVLDFFAGSGTTAAVAHKMGRQFITVEQMDYTPTITVQRLKTVIGQRTKKKGKLFEEIEFDRGGVSKTVGWQGGGSFIYLELKKYNQTFIEQIEAAKDSAALLAIWEQMKEKSFLNYNVDLKKQEAHIEDFKALSLKEQKQHLAELLDKNQLYVNLSSLNDEDFEVSKEDKMLTRQFYNIKKQVAGTR